VTVDLRTNTLLVTATAAEMKLIEEIVESVDIPSSQQGTLSGLATNEPYLQVYELNTASASEVAKTLTVLHPGMVINEDGSAKRIHIWADPQSHREIATHIRQLDGAIAGEVIAIIGLDGQNAYDVSAKLTSLYKEDAAGAPAIELDPSGRGLMIRGNASQIAQIRSLVDQLGAAGPYQSQQTMRLVPVSSSSSAFVQQAIGALYPQVTVTPSEQSESSSTSRGGDRGRSSSSDDAERAARIQRYMEMRARFGSFGRGSSDGGRNSGRGGRSRGGSGDRGSTGGGRSSRGGR
jgi:type II secretory pathway component GspD/PulD (secretin)